MMKTRLGERGTRAEGLKEGPEAAAAAGAEPGLNWKRTSFCAAGTAQGRLL